jgi:thiol-disulfide isomerase/thioredoxin
LSALPCSGSIKMIRTAILLVLSAGAVVSPCTPVIAQDNQKEDPAAEKKPAPSLKVGDLAPALKVTKWLQGDAVLKFEPGKIYVVEFWTTWCGPCIMIMPHLAELQAQNKDKGVTVIGYSARDDNNTEEKVAAFVHKRGPKLPYTFAYGEDRATYDAWMKAAGEAGIPCSFVVDKAGRLAYIGHPLFLGVVVPKVLAGVKPEAIRDELPKIQEELLAVAKGLNGSDPKAGLKALADFEAKYPPLANNPYWLRERLRSLCKVGKLAEVKQLAEAAEAKAIKYGDSLELWMLSVALLDEGKGNKELLAVAVKAAEAMVQKAGDNDPRALIHLATAYLAAGDQARAKELAQKAVAAAAGEPAALRESIEKQARRLEVPPKEDKK